MSTYRQRKAMAQEAADRKPCPQCGHDAGSHRGYPVADCIYPECRCLMEAVAYRQWTYRWAAEQEEER